MRSCLVSPQISLGRFLCGGLGRLGLECSRAWGVGAEESEHGDVQDLHLSSVEAGAPEDHHHEELDESHGERAEESGLKRARRPERKLSQEQGTQEWKVENAAGRATLKRGRH